MRSQYSNAGLRAFHRLIVEDCELVQTSPRPEEFQVLSFRLIFRILVPAIPFDQLPEVNPLHCTAYALSFQSFFSINRLSLSRYTRAIQYNACIRLQLRRRGKSQNKSRSTDSSIANKLAAR